MSTTPENAAPDDTPLLDAPDAGNPGDDVTDDGVTAPAPATGTDSDQPPASNTAEPVRTDPCEAEGGH